MVVVEDEGSGSAKGERVSFVGSMGEFTVVASAKRAARGLLRDALEEKDFVDSLEFVRGRVEDGIAIFYFLGGLER